MYMRDWGATLDDFLELSRRDLLTHAGRVSHELAVAKAEAEYEKFRLNQLAEPSAADKQFDAMVDEMKKLPPKTRTPSKRGKKL